MFESWKSEFAFQGKIHKLDRGKKKNRDNRNSYCKNNFEWIWKFKKSDIIISYWNFWHDIDQMNSRSSYEYARIHFIIHFNCNFQNMKEIIFLISLTSLFLESTEKHAQNYWSVFFRRWSILNVQTNLSQEELKKLPDISYQKSKVTCTLISSTKITVFKIFISVWRFR